MSEIRIPTRPQARLQDLSTSYSDSVLNMNIPLQSSKWCGHKRAWVAVWDVSGIFYCQWYSVSRFGAPKAQQLADLVQTMCQHDNDLRRLVQDFSESDSKVHDIILRQAKQLCNMQLRELKQEKKELPFLKHTPFMSSTETKKQLIESFRIHYGIFPCGSGTQASDDACSMCQSPIPSGAKPLTSPASSLNLFQNPSTRAISSPFGSSGLSRISRIDDLLPRAANIGGANSATLQASFPPPVLSQNSPPQQQHGGRVQSLPPRNFKANPAANSPQDSTNRSYQTSASLSNRSPSLLMGLSSPSHASSTSPPPSGGDAAATFASLTTSKNSTSSPPNGAEEFVNMDLLDLLRTEGVLEDDLCEVLSRGEATLKCSPSSTVKGSPNSILHSSNISLGVIAGSIPPFPFNSNGKVMNNNSSGASAVVTSATAQNSPNGGGGLKKFVPSSMSVYSVSSSTRIEGSGSSIGRCSSDDNMSTIHNKYKGNNNNNNIMITSHTNSAVTTNGKVAALTAQGFREGILQSFVDTSTPVNQQSNCNKNFSINNHLVNLTATSGFPHIQSGTLNNQVVSNEIPVAHFGQSSPLQEHERRQQTQTTVKRTQQPISRRGGGIRPINTAANNNNNNNSFYIMNDHENNINMSDQQQHKQLQQADEVSCPLKSSAKCEKHVNKDGIALSLPSPVSNVILSSLDSSKSNIPATSAVSVSHLKPKNHQNLMTTTTSILPPPASNNPPISSFGYPSPSLPVSLMQGCMIKDLQVEANSTIPETDVSSCDEDDQVIALRRVSRVVRNAASRVDACMTKMMDEQRNSSLESGRPTKTASKSSSSSCSILVNKDEPATVAVGVNECNMKHVLLDSIFKSSTCATNASSLLKKSHMRVDALMFNALLPILKQLRKRKDKQTRENGGRKKPASSSSSSSLKRHPKRKQGKSIDLPLYETNSMQQLRDSTSKMSHQYRRPALPMKFANENNLSFHCASPLAGSSSGMNPSQMMNFSSSSNDNNNIFSSSAEESYVSPPLCAFSSSIQHQNNSDQHRLFSTSPSISSSSSISDRNAIGMNDRMLLGDDADENGEGMCGGGEAPKRGPASTLQQTTISNQNDNKNKKIINTEFAFIFNGEERREFENVRRSSSSSWSDSEEERVKSTEKLLRWISQPDVISSEESDHQLFSFLYSQAELIYSKLLQFKQKILNQNELVNSGSSPSLARQSKRQTLKAKNRKRACSSKYQTEEPKTDAFLNVSLPTTEEIFKYLLFTQYDNKLNDDDDDDDDDNIDKESNLMLLPSSATINDNSKLLSHEKVTDNNHKTKVLSNHSRRLFSTSFSLNPSFNLCRNQSKCLPSFNMNNSNNAADNNSNTNLNTTHKNHNAIIVDDDDYVMNLSENTLDSSLSMELKSNQDNKHIDNTNNTNILDSSMPPEDFLSSSSSGYSSLLVDSNGNETLNEGESKISENEGESKISENEDDDLNSCYPLLFNKGCSFFPFEQLTTALLQQIKYDDDNNINNKNKDVSSHIKQLPSKWAILFVLRVLHKSLYLGRNRSLSSMQQELRSQHKMSGPSPAEDRMKAMTNQLLKKPLLNSNGILNLDNSGCIVSEPSIEVLRSLIDCFAADSCVVKKEIDREVDVKMSAANSKCDLDVSSPTSSTSGSSSVVEITFFDDSINKDLAKKNSCATLSRNLCEKIETGNNMKLGITANDDDVDDVDGPLLTDEDIQCALEYLNDIAKQSYTLNFNSFIKKYNSLTENHGDGIKINQNNEKEKNKQSMLNHSDSLVRLPHPFAFRPVLPLSAAVASASVVANKSCHLCSTLAPLYSSASSLPCANSCLCQGILPASILSSSSSSSIKKLIRSFLPSIDSSSMLSVDATSLNDTSLNLLTSTDIPYSPEYNTNMSTATIVTTPAVSTNDRSTALNVGCQSLTSRAVELSAKPRPIVRSLSPPLRTELDGKKSNAVMGIRSPPSQPPKLTNLLVKAATLSRSSMKPSLQSEVLAVGKYFVKDHLTTLSVGVKEALLQGGSRSDSVFDYGTVAPGAGQESRGSETRGWKIGFCVKEEELRDETGRLKGVRVKRVLRTIKPGFAVKSAPMSKLSSTSNENGLEEHEEDSLRSSFLDEHLDRVSKRVRNSADHHLNDFGAVCAESDGEGDFNIFRSAPASKRVRKLSSLASPLTDASYPPPITSPMESRQWLREPAANDKNRILSSGLESKGSLLSSQSHNDDGATIATDRSPPVSSLGCASPSHGTLPPPYLFDEDDYDGGEEQVYAKRTHVIRDDNNVGSQNVCEGQNLMDLEDVNVEGTENKVDDSSKRPAIVLPIRLSAAFREVSTTPNINSSVVNSLDVNSGETPDMAPTSLSISPDKLQSSNNNVNPFTLTSHESSSFTLPLFKKDISTTGTTSNLDSALRNFSLPASIPADCASLLEKCVIGLNSPNFFVLKDIGAMAVAPPAYSNDIFSSHRRSSSFASSHSSICDGIALSSSGTEDENCDMAEITFSTNPQTPQDASIVNLSDVEDKSDYEGIGNHNFSDKHFRDDEYDKDNSIDLTPISSSVLRFNQGKKIFSNSRISNNNSSFNSLGENKNILLPKVVKRKLHRKGNKTIKKIVKIEGVPKETLTTGHSSIEDCVPSCESAEEVIANLSNVAESIFRLRFQKAKNISSTPTGTDFIDLVSDDTDEVEKKVATGSSRPYPLTITISSSSDKTTFSNWNTANNPSREAQIASEILQESLFNYTFPDQPSYVDLLSGPVFAVLAYSENGLPLRIHSGMNFNQAKGPVKDALISAGLPIAGFDLCAEGSGSNRHGSVPESVMMERHLSAAAAIGSSAKNRLLAPMFLNRLCFCLAPLAHNGKKPVLVSDSSILEANGELPPQVAAILIALGLHHEHGKRLIKIMDAVRSLFVETDNTSQYNNVDDSKCKKVVVSDTASNFASNTFKNLFKSDGISSHFDELFNVEASLSSSVPVSPLIPSFNSCYSGHVPSLTSVNNIRSTSLSTASYFVGQGSIPPEPCQLPPVRKPSPQERILFELIPLSSGVKGIAWCSRSRSWSVLWKISKGTDDEKEEHIDQSDYEEVWGGGVERSPFSVGRKRKSNIVTPSNVKKTERDFADGGNQTTRKSRYFSISQYRGDIMAAWIAAVLWKLKMNLMYSKETVSRNIAHKSGVANCSVPSSSNVVTNSKKSHRKNNQNIDAAPSQGLDLTPSSPSSKSAAPSTKVLDSKIFSKTKSEILTSLSVKDMNASEPPSIMCTTTTSVPAPNIDSSSLSTSGAHLLFSASSSLSNRRLLSPIFSATSSRIFTSNSNILAPHNSLSPAASSSNPIHSTPSQYTPPLLLPSNNSSNTSSAPSSNLTSTHNTLKQECSLSTNDSLTEINHAGPADLLSSLIRSIECQSESAVGACATHDAKNISQTSTVRVIEPPPPPPAINSISTVSNCKTEFTTRDKQPPASSFTLMASLSTKKENPNKRLTSLLRSSPASAALSVLTSPPIETRSQLETSQFDGELQSHAASKNSGLLSGLSRGMATPRASSLLRRNFGGLVKQ